jgi:hypothetical protein
MYTDSNIRHSTTSERSAKGESNTKAADLKRTDLEELHHSQLAAESADLKHQFQEGVAATGHNIAAAATAVKDKTVEVASRVKDALVGHTEPELKIDEVKREAASTERTLGQQYYEAKERATDAAHDLGAKASHTVEQAKPQSESSLDHGKSTLTSSMNTAGHNIAAAAVAAKDKAFEVATHVKETLVGHPAPHTGESMVQEAKHDAVLAEKKLEREGAQLKDSAADAASRARAQVDSSLAHGKHESAKGFEYVGEGAFKLKEQAAAAACATKEKFTELGTAVTHKADELKQRMHHDTHPGAQDAPATKAAEAKHEVAVGAGEAKGKLAEGGEVLKEKFQEAKHLASESATAAKEKLSEGVHAFQHKAAEAQHKAAVHGEKAADDASTATHAAKHDLYGK